VGAGEVSSPIGLADHAAPDPTTGRLVMFVRVVQVRDGAAAGPKPSLRLAGATGSPVPVTTDTPIQATVGGPPIARASHTDEGGDIHVVEIEVLQSQPKWRLQIGNTDGRAHRYVVVAASSDDVRQPWLDLPVDALAFTVRVGESAAPRELPVVNHGTGPLTLTAPDGTALGSGFTLLSVTPRPIAANGRGTARVGFTTPAEPGQPAITHTFASDDPGAGTTAGHNHRVALTATVHPAPRWATGDILVLGELTLNRLDRATGRLVPVATDTAGAMDVAVDPATGDAVLLGAGFVKRVDRFTGVSTALPGFSTLTAPVGLAVDGVGTVVVVDRNAGSLVRVSRDGAREVVALTAPLFSAEPLAKAHDVSLEVNGDLVTCGEFSFFGVDHQSMVVRISRSGSLDIVSAGAPIDRTDGAQAVVVEPGGTAVVACRTRAPGGGPPVPTGSLIRVGPGAAQQLFVGSIDLRDPVSLAVTTDGTILVGAGPGLFAVHPQSGVLTRLSTASGGPIAVVPPLPA
jgi:hypothetical protein